MSKDLTQMQRNVHLCSKSGGLTEVMGMLSGYPTSVSLDVMMAILLKPY